MRANSNKPKERSLPIQGPNSDAEVFIDKGTDKFHHGIGNGPDVDQFADAFHDRNDNDPDNEDSDDGTARSCQGRRRTGPAKEPYANDAAESNELGERTLSVKSTLRHIET